MKITRFKITGFAPKLFSAALALLGVLVFAAQHAAEAQRTPPEKHSGVSVASLGVVPESSLVAQLGLGGHVMQLREISLEPGGRIARHSHATRPGLVRMLSGSWTEGRAGGERVYAASEPEALVEDERTEHWFFNDGSEPATALVCDIVPTH